MTSNRRGLSAVVTTLIIILLVLVAIGIVWVVVRGLIGTTEEQIDIQKKCIGISLEIQSASCTLVPPATTYTCTATVKKSSGEDVDGMKVVFSDASRSGDALYNTTKVDLLTTISGDSKLTGTVNKVVAAVYFVDEDEKQHLCAQAIESKVPYP